MFLNFIVFELLKIMQGIRKREEKGGHTYPPFGPKHLGTFPVASLLKAIKPHLLGTQPAL